MDSDEQLDKDKTLYTMTNEDGSPSKITLDKLASDILQEMIPDVHKWLQEKYDIVCMKKPHLSRRAKGDLVRALAYAEMVKSPRLSDF